MSKVSSSAVKSQYYLKHNINYLIARYRSLRTGYWYGLPNGLFIDVSSYCNLYCRMCPYIQVHKRPTQMTRNTFIQLLPIIKHLSSICFVGNGEPLFNKDLSSFMKLALKVNPNIKIDLTTNGTLLTESLCKEFIDLKLNKIVFSIDGANADTVESIRLGVNFQDIIENVCLLNELKKEKQSHFPIVRTNHIVAYGNYWLLPDFVLLAHRTGIKEIHFMELQAANFEDFRENFFNSISKDGGKVLKEAVKLSGEKGIRLDLPIIEKKACHDVFFPHISEEGEVFPCCFYSYDREIYSGAEVVRFPTLSLGNINKEGFRAIWNSKKYRELRLSCNTGAFNKTCNACYNAKIQTSRKIREVLTNIG